MHMIFLFCEFYNIYISNLGQCFISYLFLLRGFSFFLSNEVIKFLKEKEKEKCISEICVHVVCVT